MEGDRQVIDAPGAPPAAGPYSHAVAAGGLLFCAGQIALDPEGGELVGEDAGAQAHRCLENLSAVCVAAGASLQDAVRLTIFMTDLGSFAAVNEVCAAAFPGAPPARSTVEVSGLPRGALIEIDAIVALVGGSGGR